MGDPVYLQRVPKGKTFKQNMERTEANIRKKAEEVKAEKRRETAERILEKAKETLKRMGFSDFEIKRDDPLRKTAYRLEIAKEAGNLPEIRERSKELTTAKTLRKDSWKIVEKTREGIDSLNKNYGTNLVIEEMKPGTPEHDQIFMRVFRMSAAESEEEKSKIVRDLLEYMGKYTKKKKTEP